MDSVGSFCGSKSPGNFTFVIFNQSFGECFLWLAINTTSHVVLLICSMYLIAFTVKVEQKFQWIFGSIRSKLGVTNAVFCVLQAVLSIVQGVVSYVARDEIPPALIVSRCIMFASWTSCSVFCYRSARLPVISHMNRSALCISILLVAVSSSISLYNSIKLASLGTRFVLSLDGVYLTLNLIMLVLWSCQSWLWRGYSQRRTNRGMSSMVSSPSIQDLGYSDDFSERDRLLGYSTNVRTNTSYGSQSSIVILGRSTDSASWISKLFFAWTNCLMLKGYKDQITDAEQTFHLPTAVNTVSVKTTFNSIVRKQEYLSLNDPSGTCQKFSLLLTLWKSFGWFYLSIGILKFLSDILAFAGPILLNFLVKFMENRKEPTSHGYYYALGLFLAALVGAFLDTHYNYQVNMVRLQLRASLITAVYGKLLAASATSLTFYSSGQITNFMSTDTDRTVNFCNSFHEFWSLPFQVAVALYFLYQQVGISFLVGLCFSILMIPVNKWIATKIGKLSAKMMKEKDQRVKLMTECLIGIRILKFFAWEESFVKKIKAVRQLELSSLKGRKYLDALCVYFWATTPVLISILTFGTYILLGNKLTAAKVFTSIALFNLLRAPLNAFPWVINGLVESYISLKRIEHFLSLEDQDLGDYYTRNRALPEKCILQVDGCSFDWQHPEIVTVDMTCKGHGRLEADPTMFCLRDIRISAAKGQFIGVIGRVGSGKSSLFAALCAEMNKLTGNILLRRDFDGFGLVTQEPWIQHMTIRDNILFGQQYDFDRYNAVLDACALREDIGILPAGDMTEVGENGVTLSGGQKARISLARATYRDKSVYLLDDPLAAVDSHVASHLYEKCINGLLRDKTRILVTHRTQFLKGADLIVVLNNGGISMIDTPANVFQLQELLQDIEQEFDDSQESIAAENSLEDVKRKVPCADGLENVIIDRLVEEERREQGVVALSVYKRYWISVGHVLAASVMLFLFLMQATRNGSDWWLAYWISHSKRNRTSSSMVAAAFENGKHLDATVQLYLYIYGGIAVANTVFTLFRAFLFAYGGIVAASTIHRHLLAKIMTAKVSFFDVTPIGRIVNRFSSDMYAIDDSLPFIMNILLAQIFGVLGTIVVTCYGIPWFTAVLVPLVVIYYVTQNYYRKTSREVKRLSTVTLSPIYEHFSETLAGLHTIRAFQDESRFIKENEARLDMSQRVLFTGVAASQWLAVRLQSIGVTMIGAVAFLAVIEHHFNSINPGLVGLAISYALAIRGQLSQLVISFTETEKELVSVERASQYINNVPTEEHVASHDINEHWPMFGGVCFRNVTLIYRDGLAPALKDVSFFVRHGDKVGICGRTGSGKSSLFSVLFRMVSIESGGEMFVDGVELRRVPLATLRSRLAIIPQEPFLFSDSLRANLDPDGQFSDDQLEAVLSHCHLMNVVEQLGGMDCDVGERGQKLSVGQRQLLCLCRALLRKNKILCIDEATANVDEETDRLIQDTIKVEFADSTVLTIAHRTSSIVDSDMVMVLDNGRVSEFAPPHKLLQDPESCFSRLVSDGL